VSVDYLVGHDEMRQAVGAVLDDFCRRVRQAHSFDEIDAHRDELVELIVGIIAPRTQTMPGGTQPAERRLEDGGRA
jgi:hypothetical protein